jgi:hypothetical protein
MRPYPIRRAASLLGLLCLLALLTPIARLHAQDVTPAVTPPPGFDPAQLQPDGPLAGSDYPAAAVTPAAGPAAAANDGRPAGVDLDVLYIQRTPQYERYAVIYQDGAPLLRPGSDTAQRWPAPGEIVTFAAHVMNKGTQAAGSFDGAWYIDGELVKRETGPAVLWPNLEAVFELPWAWGHELQGERLLGAHTVRFVVDPDNTVAETFETNNVLEDRTDALALELVIAPEAYAALDNGPRQGGAFSAEDWLQRHVRAFNQALADSITPATPEGVGVRVRIDKIRIAWQQPLIDLGYDGGWFIDTDYRSTSLYYHPDEDLDWGMLHEWGHQLGLPDTYRYAVAAETVDVLRQDGSALNLGHDFPGDDLMETVRRLELGEFNAAGLDATQGYRRGYYGEYQFDLAPNIVLALENSRGCAVAGAAVAFYQRNPAAKVGEQDASRRIDNLPEFSGVTDAQGLLPLPNRPSGGAPATATGYTLHDNPFGPIEVGGGGNIGLLKLQKDGAEQFSWLTVADLNLDYWRQGRPAVQQVKLVWDAPGAAADCPPAAPTGFSAQVAGQSADKATLVLNWQNAGAGEGGVRIEWAAGSATWEPLAEVRADVTEYAVGELVCGVSYRFRVQSFNRAGVSAYSTELVYTALPCMMTLKKLYLAVVLR